MVEIRRRDQKEQKWAYIARYKVISHPNPVLWCFAGDTCGHSRVYTKTLMQNGKHVLKLIYTEEIDLGVAIEFSPELFVHLLQFVAMRSKQKYNTSQGGCCGLRTADYEVMSIRDELCFRDTLY